MAEAQICGGIDLHGATLHYAETERFGRRCRLLRLGSCDFDFDVTRALLEGGTAAQMRTVAEALGDIFAGTAASALRVVLHPPACHSFFAPLPAGLPDAERHARLLHEASLLVPHAGAADGLRLTTDALYDEPLDDEPLDDEPLEGAGAVQWHHVLVLDRHVHERFDQLMARLPHATYRWHVSTHSAARAAERLNLQHSEGAAGPEAVAYTLAVGQYPGHTEYAVCKGGTWRFGTFAETGAPADAAYFALAVLHRMGVAPAEVEHVLLYGPATAGTGAAAERAETLRRVLPARPTAFKLERLVDLDPHSLMAEFDASTYVPCVGAAL